MSLEWHREDPTDTIECLSAVGGSGRRYVLLRVDQGHNRNWTLFVDGQETDDYLPYLKRARERAEELERREDNAAMLASYAQRQAAVTAALDRLRSNGDPSMEVELLRDVANAADKLFGRGTPPGR